MHKLNMAELLMRIGRVMALCGLESQSVARKGKLGVCLSRNYHS